MKYITITLRLIKIMDNICYWLSSTKIKLISAIDSNDELKMSYLLSTNSWKVLEGIWAKNTSLCLHQALLF